MAGHSKWANIKHRKGSPGRGQRQAVRQAVSGGRGRGSPGRWRCECQRSAGQRHRQGPICVGPKGQHRPCGQSDGTGEIEGENLDEMFYEGYAPGGVALLVQILTDTAIGQHPDVRSTFTRNGGNLGEPARWHTCSIRRGTSWFRATRTK